MEYTILIDKAEESGFWSEVPAVPGCYSQGETIEETLQMRNTKEAVESHLIGSKRGSAASPRRREPLYS